MKKIFKWYLLEEEDIKKIVGRENKLAAAIDAVEAKIKWFDGDAIEDRCKRDAFIQVLDEILTEFPSVKPVTKTATATDDDTHCSMWAEEVTGKGELSLEEWKEIDRMAQVEPKQSEIIRCKNCSHNNNCEIQYAAQAGSEFFCGAAEIESENE